MEPAAARRRPTDVVTGARRGRAGRARAAASGTAARGGRRRPSFLVSRRWRPPVPRRALKFCCEAVCSFCVLWPLVAASRAVCAAVEECRAAAGVLQQHFVRKLRDAYKRINLRLGSSPDLEPRAGCESSTGSCRPKEQSMLDL